MTQKITTKIIAFTGPMGAGKSTAVKELGDAVALVKFADPLYDIQEYVYRRVYPTYKKPEGFIKDRKLLQLLGTEWGRGISPSFWVDIWKNSIIKSVDNVRGAIICSDDVRFDNEAEAVKGLGGVVVRITSKNSLNRAEGGGGISKHSSEEGISDHLVDYTVDNIGTLSEFKTKLSSLYNLLGITITHYTSFNGKL